MQFSSKWKWILAQVDQHRCIIIYTKILRKRPKDILQIVLVQRPLIQWPFEVMTALNKGTYNQPFLVIAAIAASLKSCECDSGAGNWLAIMIVPGSRGHRITVCILHF